MCRITGFWDFSYKKEYDIEHVISTMRDSMSYGGPDDEGTYISIENGLAFGHRRLSIIDLTSSGHQPMCDDEERLWIVYNGEVYNFKEIKEELKEKGVKFYSNSDTEVIIKSFLEYGYNAVNKFRGMFVFAIWDSSNKEIILCRDRIGVKPLYWYFYDNIFIFSSELKAMKMHPKFKSELNELGILSYLKYGYIKAPLSIYKNTYKLKPGSILKINKNSEIKEFKYWNIEDYFIKGFNEKDNWLKKKEEDLEKELENILTESFKLRLVSDVPVGLFLSGGIDSSLVCSILAKQNVNLKTFTIGFNEKNYDEAPYAKKIAEHLKTDHMEFYCTPKDAFDIIPILGDIYDEPFGDSSGIPTFLLSKIAKNYVKVALSADGGDEQFCGYSRYFICENRLKNINRLSLLLKFLSFFNENLVYNVYKYLSFCLPKFNYFKDNFLKSKNILKKQNFLDQYDLLLNVFLPEDLKAIGLGSDYSFTFNETYNDIKMVDKQSQMMCIDLESYLPDDLLVKVDRATMRVALEGREPLLDHKIIEWSSQLPIDLKYKNGITKYLLRKIIYKYIPKELVERKKQGFVIPIFIWFKKEMKSMLMDYLNYERINKAGIFNVNEIKRLLESYYNGEKVNEFKIWYLFAFELWREANMEKI